MKQALNEAMNVVATTKVQQLLGQITIGLRKNIERYGPYQDGAEGSVRVATVSLNGQHVMCIDSPVKLEFGFTQATSFYVATNDPDATEQYFKALSDGGEIMMPLGEYPFSKMFAWINDKFGVSWQLATT